MDADPEENRRERNRAKKPDMPQTTGAHNQQQSKSSTRGQNGQRLVKDERGNTRASTISQTLARCSYSSSSPFGVRQRSIWNKSTSGKKRNKKNVNHSLELREANPSTSVTQAETVDERDDSDDDDLETFDIDCSPFNDVETWNEDESERDERDGSRSRGGFGSFQLGRSRRTVSPYPYRLKLKKQNHDEWAVDSESCDPWDEGGFYDDGLQASGFTGIDHGREENSHFKFHADASMEDRLDELHLEDQYTVIEGDHDTNLKPCLKKRANSDDHRHAMNVSWNDENNEFDIAAADDNDYDIGVEDNDQSYALAEEHHTEITDVSLHRPDHNQESVELRSCMMKTPANFMDETVNLEIDMMKVDTRTGEIQSPPTSDNVVCHGDVDAIQCSEMKRDRDIKGDGTECCPSSDKATRPRTLLEEWTDDAISNLTNDEKCRLMKEQEHLQIKRYDDPHLCRADRIKLLWEDCARKELLLHKLRPNSAEKRMGSKGSALTTNVNRYNHYNY